MRSAERDRLLLVQANVFVLIFQSNSQVVGSDPHHIRNLAAADEGKITLSCEARAKIDFLRTQVQAYHADPHSW